jgi:hypothetical protein
MVPNPEHAITKKEKPETKPKYIESKEFSEGTVQPYFTHMIQSMIQQIVEKQTAKGTPTKKAMVRHMQNQQ